MAKYDRVNTLWPEQVPVPTDQEAIDGVRQMIRHCYRLAREDITGFTRKPKARRKFKITSGNRYTYPNQGVWRVNPKGHHFGGWKDMVHDVSHYHHRALWPNVKHGHSPRHEWIEYELTKFVVESGFLTGSLKRPEKAKPDVKAVRAQRVAARLEAWKRKRARADTAIRKLTRQAKHYGVAV